MSFAYVDLIAIGDAAITEGSGDEPCETPVPGQHWTSLPALAETIEQRLKRLGSGDAAAAERAALKRLRDLNQSALPDGSAKYACLVQRLRDIGVAAGSAQRAVVFAERVATLTWLQKHLPVDLGLPADAVQIMQRRSARR